MNPPKIKKLKLFSKTVFVTWKRLYSILEKTDENTLTSFLYYLYFRSVNIDCQYCTYTILHMQYVDKRVFDKTAHMPSRYHKSWCHNAVLINRAGGVASNICMYSSIVENTIMFITSLFWSFTETKVNMFVCLNRQCHDILKPYFFGLTHSFEQDKTASRTFCFHEDIRLQCSKFACM